MLEKVLWRQLKTKANKRLHTISLTNRDRLLGNYNPQCRQKCVKNDPYSENREVKQNYLWTLSTSRHQSRCKVREVSTELTRTPEFCSKWKYFYLFVYPWFYKEVSSYIKLYKVMKGFKLNIHTTSLVGWFTMSCLLCDAWIIPNQFLPRLLVLNKGYIG